MNAMYKYMSTKEHGFTLLELLTVIAIIGIFATVVLPNYSQARARGRDAKRITAVSEIGVALEVYYTACGRQYPATLTNGASNGCPGSTKLGDFLTIPTDPLGASNPYVYAVGGSNKTYVIRAALETNDGALFDDLDGTVIGTNCGASPEVAGAYYYCKGVQ